jgi:hypothetical protein
VVANYAFRRPISPIHFVSQKYICIYNSNDWFRKNEKSWTGVPWRSDRSVAPGRAPLRVSASTMFGLDRLAGYLGSLVRLCSCTKEDNSLPPEGCHLWPAISSDRKDKRVRHARNSSFHLHVNHFYFKQLDYLSYFNHFGMYFSLTERL